MNKNNYGWRLGFLGFLGLVRGNTIKVGHIGNGIMGGTAEILF
ncbi:hypothetical protein [Halanaerobium sp.]|jgi:hypothetical protein|nr:hypothetical protein [Halanaerobium sp.]PUU88172.1 MAG: hypothetical protein CI947_2006 [Halanaerobium sp.]